MGQPTAPVEQVVGQRAGGRVVALLERSEEPGHEEQAAHGALVAGSAVRLVGGIVDEALRPGQPPRRRRVLAPQHEGQRQPEGAARGPLPVTRLRVPEVGPLPGLGALAVETEQVGRHGEPLEVVGVRRFAAREEVAGLAPRSPGEGVPTLRSLVSHPAIMDHRPPPGHAPDGPAAGRVASAYLMAGASVTPNAVSTEVAAASTAAAKSAWAESVGARAARSATVVSSS